MSAYTDAERFLQAVFGSDFGTRAIFANLHPAVHTRELQQLDTGRDCYWSIAAFDPGHTERHLARALEVRAFVVDDVGSKVAAGAVELALGPPTAIVETSQGNFQWAYRLAPAIPVEQWGGFWRAIEELVGCSLEGKDAVHLFRLPLGVNSKPGKNRFAVHRTKLNSGIELSGISWAAPPVSKPAVATGLLDRSKLESLMQMVPNDMERDGWIEVGHGLKALCADDEDGFEVFDHWSLQHPSYDAAKTRTAWDSFGASGLRTEGGKLRARAEQLNPQGYAAWVFDDGVEPEITPGPKRNGITATPYQWIDPDKLPLRDWLYGRILVRKFISMTVAPGGTGKSSLVAVETLAQVTGKNLLGEKPAGVLRVWLWNLEDPFEETQRKIQATALHYGISEADIGGRLFVDSGREQRLVIAETDRNGKTAIVRPVVDALVEQIRLRGIDVVVVDPYVSSHAVPENDNTAQDTVIKEWGRVSEQGNCAIHLIDHTRKGLPGTEVSTESSRGAKAKTDAARVVRVVNQMTDAEGASAGVPDRWRYFRTFNDKANMAPPLDRSDWFYLESVGLGNGGTAAEAFEAGAGVVAGDFVGVPIRWIWPSATDLVTGDNFKKVVAEMGTDDWRKDYQAKEKWIGKAVAQALKLDADAPKDRKYINGVLSAWYKAGLLKVVAQKDENRKLRDFIKIAGGF